MPRREGRKLRRVAQWNMKVGRGRAALQGLRALIRDTQADVVLLQEAMNYLTLIRVLFPNWRAYASADDGEARNCVVLVRRALPRGKRRSRGAWGVVRNWRPWFYRGKGRNVRHPGRQWPWVPVCGVVLMSGHRCTEALGHNANAGAEEADHLVQFFNDHEGRPILAAFDFNNLWTDERRNSPHAIAREVGGKLIVPDGGRIDYAIARGVKATAEELGKYGSDHHAVVYDLS